MKLPITIANWTITKQHASRGMVRLHSQNSVGELEADKLLDDLPRVIGRPLTIDEQVALTLAVPGLAA
ncbi:hypothetical protein [Lacticaseibacillus manihotivorans]|jgi:hypothetical protein|uniref:Uncharacterized protein n=2 Tax=Lacticaseibacillus manihotivorans TaxID=88233 RepID=A0A0R1PZD0_9LACO|nr:hypothetical protein [Lacticaseibacillus manihotivorans]KRL37793.1 hypothetical protein FD01_GL002750 [Lacticaseibacillus manihotivorans DSM 13343 = JCM 12514]QFQ91332.1 hypothetical protein LM010_07810 [Lacticaseibacillus manihotivorans]